MVKICNNHTSIQQWSKKHDFYGDTAEDAVKSAIEYIDKKTKRNGCFDENSQNN